MFCQEPAAVWADVIAINGTETEGPGENVYRSADGMLPK